MTEQSHVITLSFPPRAVQKVVNPILRLLLRTPVMGGARKQLMVASFNGRKTGRRYSLPLSAYQIDNDLYALSDAAWTRNFRDGVTAQVLHDGKTTTMRGELIQDRAAVADLYRRFAGSYGVKNAQRMMAMKFRDQQMPTLEDFTDAVEQNQLVAIRFTPAT
jgi:hypothetical protein